MCGRVVGIAVTMLFMATGPPARANEPTHAVARFADEGPAAPAEVLGEPPRSVGAVADFSQARAVDDPEPVPRSIAVPAAVRGTTTSSVADFSQATSGAIVASADAAVTSTPSAVAAFPVLDASSEPAADPALEILDSNPYDGMMASALALQRERERDPRLVSPYANSLEQVSPEDLKLANPYTEALPLDPHARRR